MSVGYQLEQLTERGERDNAAYLATMALEELLHYFVTDGWSDEQITDLVDERLRDARESE